MEAGAVDDRVIVERIDGGARLVIEQPTALAVRFFSTDPTSTMSGGYDERAGKGARNQITLDDIRAINQTMRARSPHTAWEAMINAEAPLPWLAAIDPNWDLFATDEDSWRRTGAGVLAAAAIDAAVGPYRRMSVATKVLHLKRPRMFPVLDSLVVDQLGGRGRSPAELLLHLRSQGRSNLAVLQRVQAEVVQEGWQRTLVRIFDALLWSTNPTAGLAAQFSAWEHVVRPWRVPDNDYPQQDED